MTKEIQYVEDKFMLMIVKTDAKNKLLENKTYQTGLKRKQKI